MANVATASKILKKLKNMPNLILALNDLAVFLAGVSIRLIQEARSDTINPAMAKANQ